MKYLCDPHVIPTVVPQDLAALTSYAHACAEYTDTLHVDIADGKFAPNTTWPLVRSEQMQELEAFARVADIPPRMKLEAHLMVADPTTLAPRFIQAGFTAVTAHVESFDDVSTASHLIAEWKQQGESLIGLGALLDTPLEALDGAILSCDYLHLMSIATIGTQSIPFDDRVLARIEEIHAKYPDLLVAVDGGVSEATIELLVRAGANHLCAGSAIAKSSEPARAYATLLDRAMQGCAPTKAEAFA